MNKAVFISYSWNDREIANRIDNILMRFGVSATRDIRSLNYNTNIHNFMNTIKEHRKIIIIVSDHYLTSLNCMYEASQALEFKDRFLFIIKSDVEIFRPEHKEHYINYWKSEYDKIIKKDPMVFRNEIADTKLAYESIGYFIDEIKSANRMNDEAIDYSDLLNALSIRPTYPKIITKDVIDWIAKYESTRLSDVVSLICDLFRSSYIKCSQYSNIPDDELLYYFKGIEFTKNQNGIDIMISVQDTKTGKIDSINYSRVVQIEENTNRSTLHSKYYFYYENPSKKQKYFEIENYRDKSKLRDEEKQIYESGYLDVFRIIIFLTKREENAIITVQDI